MKKQRIFVQMFNVQPLTYTSPLYVIIYNLGKSDHRGPVLDQVQPVRHEDQPPLGHPHGMVPEGDHLHRGRVGQDH